MHTTTANIFVVCLAFGLSTPCSGVTQDELAPAEASGASVSFVSLVGELADLTAFARVPDPSYEIEIVKHVGEALAGEGDSIERTVALFEGPGAIVRLWSSNPSGIVRIYFDGEAEPAIEVAAAKLLGGTWLVSPPLAARAGRSSVLTLPLPFASGCRITCDTDADFGVAARRYDPSATVRTFEPSDLEKCEGEIAAAARLLAGVRPSGLAAIYKTGIDITGGSSLPISPLAKGQEVKKFFPARQLFPIESNLPEGGRAISSVSIKLFKYLKYEKQHEPLSPEEFEHALRFVNIGFDFDNKVFSRAPLGDFMGFGTSPVEFNDLMRTVDADGTMTSHWIMPYETSGVVELHNLSQELDVWAEVTLEVISWDWDDKSLYFMPHWSAGLETEPGERWANVTVRASHGRLVGQTMTVMNPVSDWWGGMNEVLMMGDGETLAPLGTSDLFAVDEETTSTFLSPMLSLPVLSEDASTGHLGSAVFNRIAGLDAVGFERGFSIAISADEGLKGLPDFSSLLYFYVSGDATVPTGHASYFDATRGITSPPADFDFTDPIECEDVDIRLIRTDLAIQKRDLLPRAGGRWSGGRDLFVEATDVGDAIELIIPAPNDQSNTLTLFASGGDAAGVVTIFVNGLVGVEELDLSMKPPIARSGPIVLGDFEPIDGQYVIQVQATAMGENSGIPIQFRPDAKRYAFGLDCVTITSPKRDAK